MNNKLLLFFLFMSGLVLSSCYKDLGNYTYNEINEISFDGIESEYTAFLGEPFKIEPVLKFTKDQSGDTSRYSYDWVGLRQDGVLPLEVRKQIANTRNLDLIMQLPAAPYIVYYRVTDKETGVQYQKTFKLNVVNTIYKGWLVMNDVNNSTRLDMISITDDSHKTIIDVLGSVGSSLPPQGKPKGIFCYPIEPAVYGIYLFTETGTNKIHPETFDWSPTQNIRYEMAGNMPADFKADFIVSVGGNQAYMYAQGDIYFYYRTFQINYGVPVNIMKGEATKFKAAPFIAMNGSPAAIFYNETERKFVRSINNELTCTPMPEGTLFDFNTGKDLVYMTFINPPKNEVVAILKDPDNGKYFLARFTFGLYSNSIVQTYYDEMTAPDLDKAEQFAVAPDLGYIFYRTDNKVFEYDASLKNTKLMLDMGDRKVSMIKFDPFTETNTLLVGSYDPATAASGTGGILSLYSIPPVQGDLILEKSYDGFGKIKDVTYRRR